MSASLPPEYERFAAGRATVVAHRAWSAALRAALESMGDADHATLHGFAARQDDRRTLVGRGIAYAVALPGREERVVVRHNRHGGTLAPITGDLFLPPTRATHELRVSARLIEAGVPTPLIVGYATYAAALLFRRVDVASLELPDSRDLSQVLTQEGAADRRAALEATAHLVAVLSRARARHHDLNVKNVLLRHGDERAFVLDVDRVVFDDADPREVLAANLARLQRSARKWRARWGATVSDGELAELAERAAALLA